MTIRYPAKANLLCDPVATIDAGRMVAVDSPTETERNPGRDIIMVGDGGGPPISQVH